MANWLNEVPEDSYGVAGISPLGVLTIALICVTKHTPRLEAVHLAPLGETV